MCLKAKYNDTLKIATVCGYCAECHNSKRKAWQVRCYYEALDNAPKYAIILTYADQKTNPTYLLDYTHVQAFNKRLRALGYKYRYFVSGEYGEVKGSPHFHMVIFSNTFPDLKLNLKAYKLNGYHVYTSKLLSKVWRYGMVMVQQIDGIDGLVSYLTKYYCKDSFDLSDRALAYFKTVYDGLPVPNNYTSRKHWYRTLLRPYRPKHLFSLSLGYSSWLSRISDYMANDGVYIDGKLLDIPLSWRKKYCAPLFSHEWIDGYTKGELYTVIRSQNIDIKKKLAMFERVDYHFKTAAEPIPRYAFAMHAKYILMREDYNPALIAFDSGNRPVKFDHMAVLEKNLYKEF